MEPPGCSPCAPCPRSGGSALPWPAGPHPSSAGCAVAPRYAALLWEQGDPSAPHLAQGPPAPPSRCVPLTAAVSGRFQLLDVFSLPLQLQIRFMQLLPVRRMGSSRLTAGRPSLSPTDGYSLPRWPPCTCPAAETWVPSPQDRSAAPWSHHLLSHQSHNRPRPSTGGPCASPLCVHSSPFPSPHAGPATVTPCQPLLRSTSVPFSTQQPGIFLAGKSLGAKPRRSKNTPCRRLLSCAGYGARANT